VHLYWTRLEDEQCSLVLAATDQGVCCVGITLEEIQEWGSKHLGDAELVEAPEKMALYKSQLQEYLAGDRTIFDLPLDLKGTPFQLKVFEALQQIPYGSTVSYADIAVAIGNPKAVRAVGGAIGKNPVLIAVPCHRVIGKNGTLTGFSSGIPLKKKLLTIEKVPFKD